MKKKGFTLVELLVVIAIIALLVSILLPSLNRAKELAKQTMCRSNLAGMGKSYAIYLSENEDKYPLINNPSGHFCWTTGWYRKANPITNKTRDHSISALMWMLVRGGNDPGLFICPSDSDGVKCTDIKDANDTNNVVYHYDFLTYTNVSYSHQMVTVTAATTSSIPFSDPKQFLLADKNPNWDGGMTGASPSKWDGVQLSDINTSEAKVKLMMSQNHNSGEMINTLLGDGTAKLFKRPDIGELLAKGNPPDNIYTAGGQNSLDTGTQSAATWTKPPRSWGGAIDAFLVGPFKAP